MRKLGDCLDDWGKLERRLGEVTKLSRYIGGEYNSTVKDWNEIDFRVALCFPDTYEIGLSHLGLRIIYELINNHPSMLAERAYAPWADFQQLLRELDYPLYALESKRGLHDFDVVGFSLQYEMSYTNVLLMLDLGKIPLHAAERTDNDPLVYGGGPCTFNPECVAEFFDFFFIGEAEDNETIFLERIRELKQAGKSRAEILRALTDIPGIYVPSHFNVAYNDDGTISEIASLYDDQPQRAVVADFDRALLPQKWIVPFMEIVHDRVATEIQRGCTRGCRFCQAGMIYRPVREREQQTVFDNLKHLVADTGYEEISLTSLSSADYTKIDSLLPQACEYFTPQQVAVSLPSLRIDSFSIDLANKFQSNRKGSLTFAPEAGTVRLRAVINKGVTEDDLMTASGAAFRLGWQKLKLYFMLGLPTETDEDLDGIVRLARAVERLGRETCRFVNGLRINVSVSTFVPKPCTPFQWRSQISIEETERKQRYLQENLRGKTVQLSWHDPITSYMEGIFARGDRRLSAAILAAYRLGAQFDGWGDCFKYELWQQAFAETGINPDFYLRERSYDEILPWSHLNLGLKEEFLKNEDRKATMAEQTPDCRRNDCSNCGVCTSFKVKRRMAGGVEND